MKNETRMGLCREERGAFYQNSGDSLQESPDIHLLHSAMFRGNIINTEKNGDTVTDKKIRRKLP